MSAGDLRRDEARAELRAQLGAAGRIVSPVWPVGTFVAVNPLWGLVDRPFEEAVATARPLLGIRGLPGAADLRRALEAGRVTEADVHDTLRRQAPELDDAELADRASALLSEDDAPVTAVPRTAAERFDAAHGTRIAELVDEQVATWCAAWAAADAGGPQPPGRERGLYGAWRELAGRGPVLRRLTRPGLRARLAAGAERADDAVLAALDALRIPAPARSDELRGHLGRQPGWASWARWCEEQGAPGIDLAELLAVRLTVEAELLAAAGGAESPPPPAKARPADPGVGDGVAVLAALEGAYADGLLTALDRPAPAPREARPAAQAVFCIDARSEGLRRHLEEVTDVETLGFAGFFAVAMRFRALGSARADAQAPVLLDPQLAVDEVAAAAAEQRVLQARAAQAGAEHGLHAAKHGGASPFTLAELGGWAAGPLAAAKTFAAGTQARLRERAAQAAAGDPASTLDIDAALPPEGQLALARTALVMMGLTDGFARVVLLCGHGSTSENNPYAAALDCGACGGHQGGPNARAAATILNRPAVRDGLAADGIVIPADTWFVAGRHDTTTDRVTLLELHTAPDSHHADLERLQAALDAAGAAQAAERLALLPGAGSGEPARRARRRSADWAQVRPEWGLARNAAFIAGPRAMTQGLDLGCRTFLHSYDAAIDTDGSALETILTAPLVVAHWINAQYLFSTTDPDVLGAGDKVVHNVVGTTGVVLGPGGDLRIGLPRQACFAGDEPFHEPLRLLAVVEAPRERIDTLIARNAVLRHLFDGEWVSLAARERPGDRFLLRRGGAWEPWTPASDRAEALA